MSHRITSLTALFLLLLSMTELTSGQAINYSLWPKRPAEIEQARAALHRGDTGKARALLAPFVNKQGPMGYEARRLLSTINKPIYLSANHPRVTVHTVRRGENIVRIAAAYKSTATHILLINGLMDPSELKVGQRLNVAPADLRAELHPAAREITVWDGNSLVASFDMVPGSNFPAADGNEELTLRSVEGEINGARIPPSSMLFASSNRLLRLSNNYVILNSAHRAPSVPYIRMQAIDLNELSLLLGKGARVSLVRDAAHFDPFGTEDRAAP